MELTEPIRNKTHLKKLEDHFLKKKQYRNYLLLVTGAHTALRISDILRLKWQDVYEEENEKYRSHITFTESKTGKTKIIAIHRVIIKALHLYYPHRKGEFLFTGNRKSEKAISRVQAWQVLRSAAEQAGLGYNVSAYSLRKTYGYHAWKDGVPVNVIMDIYNHSSYEMTRRYLGVAQDDIDRAYLKAKLF